MDESDPHILTSTRTHMHRTAHTTTEHALLTLSFCHKRTLSETRFGMHSFVNVSVFVSDRFTLCVRVCMCMCPVFASEVARLC